MTPEQWARESRAYSVRCTLCGAAPMRPCLDERRRENKVPHLARLDAYARWQHKAGPDDPPTL